MPSAHTSDLNQTMAKLAQPRAQVQIPPTAGVQPEWTRWAGEGDKLPKKNPLARIADVLRGKTTPTVGATAATGRFGAATPPTPRVDITAAGRFDGPLARPLEIPPMWQLGQAGWQVAAEGGVLRLGDGGEVVELPAGSRAVFDGLQVGCGWWCYRMGLVTTVA